MSQSFSKGTVMNDQKLRCRFGIERHPYTKRRIDKIPCVYVCVTTLPKNH